MAGRYPAIFPVLALSGCGTDDRGGEANGRRTVVFKHGKLVGDQTLFCQLIDRFERENPDITVKDETLPASTDEQHQFYIINLEGKSRHFDVLSVDAVWVPEFARAGWLRDISHLFSPDEEKGFFPGPMEAVRYEGSIYAIPWYVDADILCYRKDLLDKYDFSPPRTWDELVGTAQYITAREQNLYGFVWQGKQYEGLVCNVLEYIRSNGGEVLRDGKSVINSPENQAAIAFMRDLMSVYKVTSPLATTVIEESARHIFGNGRALFMRNRPYAWNIYEKEGSPVRGKVGVVPLPAFPQGRSAPTLGGWRLGINRHSRRPEAAEKLVYFTGMSVSVELFLGLCVAMLLNRQFPFRGIVRAVVLVLWSVPTVVSARMWEWIYNTDFGILNYLVGTNVNRFGSTGWAINAAVFTDVWKTTPFVAILFMAGLQVIPGKLYRAAQGVLSEARP